MKRLAAILIACLGVMLTSFSQSIAVEDFKKLWKIPIIQAHKFETDKEKATIDFATDVKGFAFKANGKEDAPAEETDNGVTVKVPDGTYYLSITHPQYGSYLWRVPGGNLKKNKRYKATLKVVDPTKELKPDKQWVTFTVNPPNAIVTIDTIVNKLRNGYCEAFLPLGKHGYSVVSPFYDTVADTVELTDVERTNLTFNLQPTYSYVTITSPFTEMDIAVDGEIVGTGKAVSQRVSPGMHKIQLSICGRTMHESVFTVGKAEKITVDIPYAVPPTPGSSGVSSNRLTMPDSIDADKIGTPKVERTEMAAADKGPKRISAKVRIEKADSLAKIYINREFLSDSVWEGTLPEGEYALTTVKDGKESGITWLIIDDEVDRVVTLPVTAVYYGILSICCDAPGADIYINGEPAGTAPATIANVDATQKCEIRLRKPGYRDAIQVITPNPNQITVVSFNLKKK